MKQLEGQISIFDLDTWCGKTCQGPSVQTVEKISEPCLKKPQGSKIKLPLFLDLTGNGPQVEQSWVMGGALLGEYTMHSFGECPKEEKESLLSQILEDKPHPKYCLSAKACQGILNRANKRGKELPPILKMVLEQQALPLKSEGGVEFDKYGHRAGKGALIQNELSGTLGVSQDQTLITGKCLNGWDVQSKHIQPEEGKAEALYSGECRGGGGESYVMQKCYGISSYDSNAMKSPNPKSGVYEADTSRTLDNNGGNPSCNQGGIAVVETYQKTTGSLCASGYSKLGTQEAMNDMYVVGQAYDGSQISPTITANNADGSQRMPDKNHFTCVIGVDCYNSQLTGDKTMSMTGAATDSHHIPCVTYGLDRASFNQGQNAKFDFAVEEEKAPTLVAKGPGGVCNVQSDNRNDTEN